MVFFKNKFIFFHIWKEYSGFLVNCVVLVAKSYPTLLWPPWATAHQVPLSMGFPRREYWSGLPFPSPGDLPKPGIEPKYLALAGRFFITEPPGSPSGQFTILQKDCYQWKNCDHTGGKNDNIFIIWEMWVLRKGGVITFSISLCLPPPPTYPK